MVGTFPKTKLLLTTETVVIGEFDSYLSVGLYFKARIDDKGHVFFNEKKQNPEYCLKEKPGIPNPGCWKKREALADWCRNYMKLPHGYKVYRFIP